MAESETIRAGLDGIQGVTLGSVAIESVLVEGRSSRCVSYGSGGDQYVFAYQTTYRIQYVEAATVLVAAPVSTATTVEGAAYALLGAVGLGVHSLTPHYLPEATTLPAAAYLVVSDVPTHDLDGHEAYRTARVQASVFDWSEATVSGLLGDIRAGLDGFTGTVGDLDLAVLVQDDLVMAEYAEDDSDLRKFHGVVDLMVRYQSAGN